MSVEITSNDSLLDIIEICASSFGVIYPNSHLINATHKLIHRTVCSTPIDEQHQTKIINELFGIKPRAVFTPIRQTFWEKVNGGQIGTAVPISVHQQSTHDMWSCAGVKGWID